jgi:hypothetical protein
VNTTSDTLPDDINALKAALLAERAARREFVARASGAEAMVAHLKLLIAKMKRDRFGASAERGRKLLDQLEMQLEELETASAEDEVAAATAAHDNTAVPSRCGHHCQRICPASASYCHRRRAARAAVARSPNSGRRSPRRWRAFHGPTR